ncbi:N-6 DNA methylase [Catellatospora bangladeshensis]|uniref:N-6 DNA methylase n=1 Tax=Catellatospora bangladeshensis TaxID=310355 RepID=UPI00361F69F7
MPVTVTMAQIAKFAQVQRPSVSNWRRRHGDFPRPIGGSATQPLFDAEQVAQWLDQRPTSLPQQRSATYGELFREGLRRGPAVGTHSADADADARVRAGLAVAALRHLHGRPLPTSEEQLRATAEAAEAQHVDLTGVFQPVREHPAVALSQLAEVERLIGQLGAPAAAEAIIESAGGTWWAAPTQTPTAISDLAIHIASELLGESGELAVADLAAGSGAFLATAASRGRARTARYAETDPAAVELMRLRLLCHGLRDVAPHDGRASADVVFADPPFQSGEHEQQQDHPLSWAASVVECLDDDAVGFAVVPQWTLTRTATATRLPVTWSREQLVRRGCVRAIIQLPRHVHPYLGGADLVLLVLAADTGDTTRQVVVCDADRVRARVGATWTQHTAELVCGSATRDARLCREVPASELLAGRTLLPAHLLTPQAAPQDHLLDAVRARTTAIATFTAAVDAVSALDRIDITPGRREPCTAASVN